MKYMKSSFFLYIATLIAAVSAWRVDELKDHGKDDLLDDSRGLEERTKKVAKKSDGICDKDLNNLENGWDGGDCNLFNRKYPRCKAADPWRVGNGYCQDWGGHNTKACGFDGGDCIPPTGYPNCKVPSPNKVGDGTCHWMQPEYNTKDCGYDGGDCLVPKYPDCKNVNGPSIGNGSCENNRRTNTEACGFDGGDCVGFNKLYPKCRVDPKTLGDGRCDPPNNSRECGSDAGDCLKKIPTTGCTDSTLKAKITKNDGSVIYKNCAWVAKLDARCNLPNMISHCPGTCDKKCNYCKDPYKKVNIRQNRNGKFLRKTCSWVADKIKTRCEDRAATGCPNTCVSTCKDIVREDSTATFNVYTNKQSMIADQTCSWVRRSSADRCNVRGVRETCRKTCPGE